MATENRTNERGEPQSVDELRQRLQTLQRKQPHYPLQLSLVSRLAVLVEKRMVEVCQAVLKPLGISYLMYQCLVLAYASDDRALTPSELARATGERNTNITHICDELERRQLIVRRPSMQDRRRVVIELTAAGEAMLHQAQQPIWQAWSQRYQGFDAERLQLLEQLLDAQLINLLGPESSQGAS